MKLNPLKTLLLVLFASICMAQIGHCQDIYQTIHKKADLPTGGEFVPNPKNKLEIYYFTNEMRMWTDKSNAQKHSGLYRSADEGQTWNLVCHFFEFKKLFIHPNTNELFAIVEDNIIAPGENGFLTVHRFDKAIVSKEGKHWKDIMGKQQRASSLSRIFVDPEHPQRVRLAGWAFRSYELIAVDDNYTDWKQVVIQLGPTF